MKKVRKEREDEIRAREIVCTALGATAEVLDRGPLQGVADYRIQVPGLGVGVLEVTTHGDPLRINLGKQMDRGGWEQPSARVGLFWSISLPPIERDASRLPYRYVDVIGRLDELEEILEQMEAAGLLEFGPRHEGPLADRLRDLGVHAAHGIRKGEPGLYFLPPGQGGGLGPGVVTAAVAEEAGKPDNRRKLERGPFVDDAAEDVGAVPAESNGPFAAHLFVWISPDRMLAFQSLADQETPAPLGPVAPEATDIWVAGQFRSGEVVWRWSDEHWSRVVTDRALQVS